MGKQKKDIADTIRGKLAVGKKFRLADVDPSSTPGFAKGKKKGRKLLEASVPELSEIQEKLFANKDSDHRRVLLVIQGLDTAGKGGIMRHVVGSVDPQGVHIAAFKAPTEEEKRNHWLWRIEKELPQAGEIAVFDRSHYEDVLVVRVEDLVPPQEWSKRYDIINEFEARLVEEGTTVVKVMLHISKDEQRARLQERLDRSDKWWKFNPGDIDTRLKWDDYMEAYQAVFDETTTKDTPWYVVPADKKWYARLAVQQILLSHLRELDLTWPQADFDVDREAKRLAKS